MSSQGTAGRAAGFLRVAVYGAVAVAAAGLALALVLSRVGAPVTVVATPWDPYGRQGTGSVLPAPPGGGYYSTAAEDILAEVLSWRMAGGDQKGALEGLKGIKDDGLRDRVAFQVVTRFLRAGQGGQAEGRVTALPAPKAPPTPAPPPEEKPKGAKPADPGPYIALAREIKDAGRRAGALVGLAKYKAQALGDQAGAAELFAEAMQLANKQVDEEAEAAKRERTPPLAEARFGAFAPAAVPGRPQVAEEPWWSKLGSLTGWLLLCGAVLAVVGKVALEEFTKAGVRKVVEGPPAVARRMRLFRPRKLL